MNNASKGRCVTVTPRGKSEDETLKAKPGLRKGQCFSSVGAELCGQRIRENKAPCETCSGNHHDLKITHPANRIDGNAFSVPEYFQIGRALATSRPRMLTSCNDSGSRG
jgi:hypothetical protein